MVPVGLDLHVHKKGIDAPMEWTSDCNGEINFKTLIPKYNKELVHNLCKVFTILTVSKEDGNHTLSCGQLIEHDL